MLVFPAMFGFSFSCHTDGLWFTQTCLFIFCSAQSSSVTYVPPYSPLPGLGVTVVLLPSYISSLVVWFNAVDCRQP